MPTDTPIPALGTCCPDGRPAVTDWASKRADAQEVVRDLLTNHPQATPAEVRAAVRAVYGLPQVEGPRDEDAPADVDAALDLPPWEVRRQWHESTRDEPTAAELALLDQELREEADE